MADIRDKALRESPLKKYGKIVKEEKASFSPRLTPLEHPYSTSITGFFTHSATPTDQNIPSPKWLVKVVLSMTKSFVCLQA